MAAFERELSNTEITVFEDQQIVFVPVENKGESKSLEKTLAEMPEGSGGEIIGRTLKLVESGDYAWDYATGTGVKVAVLDDAVGIK